MASTKMFLLVCIFAACLTAVYTAEEGEDEPECATLEEEGNALMKECGLSKRHESNNNENTEANPLSKETRQAQIRSIRCVYDKLLKITVVAKHLPECRLEVDSDDETGFLCHIEELFCVMEKVEKVITDGSTACPSLRKQREEEEAEDA